MALFASHYDQLLFSRSLRACSTELLPLGSVISSARASFIERMPSAACPPILDVIGDLLADACRIEELLLSEAVDSRLSALICNFHAHLLLWH